MKYSSPVEKDGISDEITRITGATVAVYSNYDRVSRVNNALDQYFNLAREASRQWSIDDDDQTSPPIETQNIVSGTNRYKFSSFTSEIIDLIKLEVLDSDGKGRELIPETFDSLGSNQIGNTSGRLNSVSSNTFQELYLNTTALTGVPTHYCKFAGFVYLRPTPNYAETSGLKAYFTRPLTRYSFVTFTVTIASPGVFTATAHGLAANDAVIFETDGALPTGLTADTVVYYVISAGLTADAFEVSATIGGSAVNTSGSQSGNHKFLKVSKEPGIPSIHHVYLARYASLPFLIEKGLPQAGAISQQIQLDEMAIKSFFANRGRDISPRLSVFRQDNR